MFSYCEQGRGVIRSVFLPFSCLELVYPHFLPFSENAVVYNTHITVPTSTHISLTIDNGRVYKPTVAVSMCYTTYSCDQLLYCRVLTILSNRTCEARVVQSYCDDAHHLTKFLCRCFESFSLDQVVDTKINYAFQAD